MGSTPDFRDVHRIVELIRQLTNVESPDKLTEEAKRILGSTEPEYEFMAIATWSGRCSLIHKLPPDKYPSDADTKYKIPDLFAVFEYEGRAIPALVEVKSTFTPTRPGPIKTAALSSSYRQKLKNYGKLLGLPVLIAQKINPPGIWFLVDLETVGIDGKSTVNPVYDLSTPLLGTFHLTFKAGTKFVLRIEDTRSTNDKEFEGTIRAAHWETADGVHIDSAKSPMMLLFGLGDPVERQEYSGDTAIITFEIPSKISFANYQGLRAAILYDKDLKDTELPWAAMLHSGKFPISYSSVESAKEDVQFFEHSFRSRPKEIPRFLKPA